MHKHGIFSDKHESFGTKYDILAGISPFPSTIVDDIQANINLFANDTSLSITVGDPADIGSILQSDIDKVTLWAQRWLVKFNPAKSESLVISRKCFKPAHPSLLMSNTEILSVTSHNLLGFFSF